MLVRVCPCARCSAKSDRSSSSLVRFDRSVQERVRSVQFKRVQRVRSLFVQFSSVQFGSFSSVRFVQFGSFSSVRFVQERSESESHFSKFVEIEMREQNSPPRENKTPRWSSTQIKPRRRPCFPGKKIILQRTNQLT